MLRCPSILALLALLTPAAVLAQPARSFEELIAEAPFVVRVAVERTGSASLKLGPRASVSFELAVVRVRSYLRGDPASVLPAYRKRFPVFSASMFVDGDTHGHGPAPLASALYAQKAGAEVLLFIDLPSKDGNSRPGRIPPEILREFGPYDTTFLGMLPATEAGRVTAALKRHGLDQRSRRAQAAKSTLRDRFVEASRQALRRHGKAGNKACSAMVDEVAGFLRDELRSKRRLSIRRAATRSAPHGDHLRFVVTLEQQLEGRWKPAGELVVILDPRDAALYHFQLDGALLRSLTRAAAVGLDAKRTLASVRAALRVVIDGVQPQHEVNAGLRGDGVHLISVVIFAARTRNSYFKSLHLDLTATGQVIYRYTNDWR